MLVLQTNADLGRNSLAPVVNIATWDRELAPFMKHMVYYVDPQYALGNTPPLNMRDRRSGLVVSNSSPTGPVKTSVDAAFNNRATLDYTLATDNGVKLNGAALLDDITIAVVATRPATAGIMFSSTLLPGGVYGDIFRTIGNDTHITYGAALNSGAESRSVSTAGMPPRETPALYVISYREATKTSRLYVNNPTTPAGGDYVHPTAKSAGPSRANAEYTIGGLANGGIAWAAKMGELFVFSIPVHLPEYDALRTSFMSKVKARYAIA